MGPDETGPIPELPEAATSAEAARPSGESTRRWILFGALAAVALAGAVFALVPRQASVEERIEQAMKAAFERGASAGAWEIRESRGDARKRTFADDAANPARVYARYDDAEHAPILSFPRSVVALRVFGEGPIDLFLRNYRPAGARTTEQVDGRAALRVEWTAAIVFGEGAARTVWMDEASGDLVGLEDRAFDGALIHSARLLTRALGEWHLVAAAQPSEGRGSRERAACCQSLEEVVRRAPFPIYEPTRLPPGFKRTETKYLHWDARGGATIDLVHFNYSDGLAKIEEWIARPEDLKRLDELSAKRDRADPAGCPTSTANTPEDLVSDESILIRRRANRCRTVLRVDPVAGLAVEVIGRNELPPEAYLTAIRSLERVPGSKDLPAKAPEGEKKPDAPPK